MQTTTVLLSMLVGASAPPVDFDTEIIPILTRAGCNRGACHGAAIGRGGFKLSLYGGDPAADYEAIVHQLEGRRVNLAHPERSLVLRKPLNEIEHEGGMRLELDAPDTERMLRWLREGARRRQSRTLVDLHISPRSQLVPAPDTTIPLQATATFSNGDTENVTNVTVFTAEDPAAVKIDAAGATATIRRRGRHVVMARYLDRVVALEFLVPLAADAAAEVRDTERPADSTEVEVPLIDEPINRRLATLRIPPSPPATDTEFLRRVTLDLTGRLPTPETVRRFVRPRPDASPDRTATRRTRLVDALLESPEFVDYWTYRLAMLLRIRAPGDESQGARAFHDWLRKQVAADRPFDEMARTLLTAEGDTHTVGPANFYRVTGSARDQAEYVSELFMGVRLRCANCHNHPLDRWTQDDYHGLAAIFARLERGRVIKVLTRGEVTHPATGQPALPRIPGERNLDPRSDGRDALAEWLTGPANPYFARAIVNRLWSSLFGRGLVEPVDDIRATNPPTHPELLEALGRDFTAHGCSLKHTLRLIATSATYARSSQPLPDNAADQTFYSHALARPLPAEVLADAFSDALGVSEAYGDLPGKTRAIALLDTQIASRTLDVLGRCSREASCESGTTGTDRLSQMLYAINGRLLNPRLIDPASRLQTWLREGLGNGELVERAYLQTLARFPSQQEQEFWLRELEQADSEASRRQVAEDFYWSLLTCREFVSNH